MSKHFVWEEIMDHLAFLLESSQAINGKAPMNNVDPQRGNVNENMFKIGI